MQVLAHSFNAVEVRGCATLVLYSIYRGGLKTEGTCQYSSIVFKGGCLSESILLYTLKGGCLSYSSLLYYVRGACRYFIVIHKGCLS